MNDEQKISQRYRELGREEPPSEIDAAILAAARRAAETRPAPLVVPTGRRRWYFPVAAAAVIVLAVAVTMHVEREQPDQEALVAPSANVLQGTAEAEKAAPAPAPQPAPAAPAAPARKATPAREFTPDPKPQAQPEPAPAPAPASPPQVMQESQPAAAADQRLRDQDRLESQRLALERQRLAQERAAQEALSSQQRMRQSAGARPAAALSMFAERSPEQWLQGIDDLKRQGRHDEAEKQLAEFRKRYPDYRIPEAITEKFEKAR